MRDILKNLSYLLDRREKWQVVGLFGLLLIGSLLEMLGVGFVVPFISLISQPDRLAEQPILGFLHTQLGSPSVNTFLIIICLIYLGIYVTKNVYIAMMYHLQYKFIFNKQRTLADKLLHGYLGASYTFHLQRNTAVLIRNLVEEVNQLFMQVLIPLVLFITELTVLTGLAILLVALKPITSLVAATAIIIAALAFYHFVQRKLYISGQKRQYSFSQVMQHISQGLGGIKEIKTLGREEFFLERHSIYRAKFVKSLQFIQTIQQLPRLYFETLAVVCLLVVVIVTTLYETSGEVLPTISLFAAAAFRLMPSINRVVSSLNKMRFGSHALDVLAYEFRLLEKERNLLTVEKKIIPSLQAQLSLDTVCYHYPNAEEDVLREVSIEIPKGTSVGFVGSSGAGKTTLVDIILGLLTPTAGRVLVDGVDIQQGVKGWQRQIGYIPQSIYLCDDTLRGNIAFGIPETEICEEQVWAAVRSAQLLELVERLPEGLDTVVGERGVRLSGGQRQRVGIARALYHNPQVLVMDEATAALDNETEAKVMEAVEQLSGEKTLIMIAHRLTTVKNCDCLYFMKKGKVIDKGTYTELKKYNEAFMKMAIKNN